MGKGMWMYHMRVKKKKSALGMGSDKPFDKAFED
jgi:hypothetical protein